MNSPVLTVVIFNVPRGSSPAQIAELFWTQVGLQVDPVHITTKDHEFSTSAFVRVSTANLVEFLNRNFETCTLATQREPVRFEVKKVPVTIKLP